MQLAGSKTFNEWNMIYSNMGLVILSPLPLVEDHINCETFLDILKTLEFKWELEKI